MTTWRQRAHDAGLIFCASVAVYLISTVTARLVGVQVASDVRGWESTVARVALGVVVMDLTRLPALVLTAGVFGGSLQVRPIWAAVGLVLTTYGLDAMIAFLLGQSGPLFGAVPVLLLRTAATSLLIWITCLVFRRRRR